MGCNPWALLARAFLALPAHGTFQRLAASELCTAVNTDDSLLIAECLEGRTDAFGHLVRKYQDRLYTTLALVLGSRDEALDAAQDTFIRAFQSLRSFRGKSAFYTWLYRIAVNTATSLKRRRRDERSIEQLRYGRGPLPGEGVSGDPADPLLADERSRRVHAAIGELSEDHRNVIVLKEIEQCTYEEIAEVLGCPIGTVRSRLHRARMELREKLRDFMGSGEPDRGLASWKR